MSGKLSVFRLQYCPSIIGVQILCLNSSPKRFSAIFTMKLATRQRTAVFYLEDAMYAVLAENYLVTCVPYQWSSIYTQRFQQLQGIFKSMYVDLAGYAIMFKKRFYLSGQVNRIKRLKRNKIILQLGYTHNVRIYALKHFVFRRWRRKRFGIQIKSNNFNVFNAFIDLFRHIRFRAKYTSRGIRLKRDRFKMKFRPDHGKYGFKMNY